MKKFMFKFCIMLIAVVVLAACSSQNKPANNNTANNDTSSNQPAAVDDKKQDVTLRFAWWGSEGRHKALLDAIDLYMELNEHVTIEPEYGGFDGYYQKLITQFTGGTAPDLTPLAVTWIDELAVKADLVYDLNELAEHINLAAFDADYLQKYATFNGKLAGLPMGLNGITIVYNKDFFEKYNIPEDTQWDWETIHTVGKQVHEQDPDAYLLGFADDYREFLQPFMSQVTGKQWVEDDFTVGFDAAQLTQAFTYYKTLLDDGVIQPVTESSLFSDVSENTKWMNGQIGMTFSLASAFNKFTTSTPNLGVSMYPVAADAKVSGILVNPSNPLAISKSSKHPEEAAKFASWLLTDSQAAELLGDVYSVPAVEASMHHVVEKELINPNIAKAVELAMQNPGNPVNGISGNQEIVQIAEDLIEQVAFDRLSPEQAAEELVQRTTDKLKDIQ